MISVGCRTQVSGIDIQHPVISHQDHQTSNRWCIGAFSCSKQEAQSAISHPAISVSHSVSTPFDTCVYTTGTHRGVTGIHEKCCTLQQDTRRQLNLFLIFLTCILHLASCILHLASLVCTVVHMYVPRTTHYTKVGFSLFSRLLAHVSCLGSCTSSVVHLFKFGVSFCFTS